MKKQRQLLVTSILSTGRYKYDNGNVMSFRNGEWKTLKGCVLPSGYKQHTIYNGKRYDRGAKATVYAHILVYMIHHGEYTEGYEIDHIDRDVSNNRIDNLRAVPTYINHKNRNERPTTSQGTRTIRSKEIKQIRELHSQGCSQSAIARKLDLHRLSVRHIVKQIDKGIKLKYEL